VLWNEQDGNNCSFNIFLCPQEAIASSIDDPIILGFHDFAAYFNESNYDNNKKIWSSNAEGYQINVSGISYKQGFLINLSGRTADVPNIAKSLVAGFREYFLTHSFFNRTVDFFCAKSGLSIYNNLDDCYKNNVTVVLNDNVPWKLAPIPPGFSALLSPPDYKFVYYDPSANVYSNEVYVKLAFFAYSSNIEKIKNMIFVSPMAIITSSSPVCIPANECHFPQLNSAECCGNECNTNCKCVMTDCLSQCPGATCEQTSHDCTNKGIGWHVISAPGCPLPKMCCAP
jgi:hypothetical protein